MARIRTPELNSVEVRRIAVEASADPRTVVRHLTGLTVAGTSAERIDAALVRLGLKKSGANNRAA